MILGPAEFEAYSRAITGKDRKAYQDVLFQTEKKIHELTQEISRQENQLLVLKVNLSNDKDNLEVYRKLLGFLVQGGTVEVEYSQLPAPKPTRKIRRDSVKQQINEDEFVSWYNLVYEKYKVYPTGRMCADWFGGNKNQMIKYKIGLAQRGLIPGTGTKSNLNEWRKLGVTLDHIRVDFGLMDEDELNG